MAESGSVRFGECAYCGEPLERPFWDTVCFDCQEDRNAELAADDEALNCDEYESGVPVAEPPPAEEET